MSGANSCVAKQATPIPRQQDMCSEALREEFVLISTNIGGLRTPILARQTFGHEGDARRAAEIMARGNRFTKISIARIIATVHEPLLTLQWSDGGVAGDGHDGQG